MIKKCKIEGCEKEAKSRGYCTKHYFIWRNQNQTKHCIVENCDTIVYSKGYCRKHYSQMWRYGIIKTKEPKKHCISLIQEYKSTLDIYEKVIGVHNRVRLRKQLQLLQKRAEEMDINLSMCS